MTLLEEKSNHENSNNWEFRGLKKKEIERLRSFLTSLNMPNTPYTLARSSKYFMTSSFSALKDYWHGNWVIDSGDANRMTTTLIISHLIAMSQKPKNQSS